MADSQPTYRKAAVATAAFAFSALIGGADAFATTTAALPARVGRAQTAVAMAPRMATPSALSDKK